MKNMVILHFNGKQIAIPANHIVSVREENERVVVSTSKSWISEWRVDEDFSTVLALIERALDGERQENEVF